MRKIWLLVLSGLLFVVVITGVIYLKVTDNQINKVPVNQPLILPPSSPAPTIALSPQPTLPPLPVKKTLVNDYHIFQTFNNCGPASLSMALSYYGLNVSQHTLGQELRPYQNPQGDNDDKSVTLEELALKAEEYGFTVYHRPAGSVELVKNFVAYDMPVIARTLLKENDDIGHFRVIKGYNDTTQEFIQDDSLQGHNLAYSYDQFNNLWKFFNYEYLVLVPSNKREVAQNILKDAFDVNNAWQKAARLSRQSLSTNPNDIFSRFNLSVALYHLNDFAGSAQEFEQVENQLPFRTLWYQIEPILAYYQLGDYERVFSLTNKILNNHNRAFSELYVIRSQIYKKQGSSLAAQEELDKAYFYNPNLNEQLVKVLVGE